MPMCTPGTCTECDRQRGNRPGGRTTLADFIRQSADFIGVYDDAWPGNTEDSSAEANRRRCEICTRAEDPYRLRIRAAYTVPDGPNQDRDFLACSECEWRSSQCVRCRRVFASQRQWAEPPDYMSEESAYRNGAYPVASDRSPDGWHCGLCLDAEFEHCGEHGIWYATDDCPRCEWEAIHHIDDDDDDDDDDYDSYRNCRCHCEDCCNHGDYSRFYQAVPGTINGYSYKPRPEFRGEGPLYLGAEIEVTTAYRSQERAAKAVGDVSDVLYLKDDGSISCGFEIVTHPMSYEWAMENFPWDKWANVARAHLGTDETTGLHVHVSKAAFALPSHDYRWIQFVYRNSAEMIKLARRESERWAPFRDSDRRNAKFAAKRQRPACGLCNACREARGYCTDRDFEHNRYAAINATNSATYEMRIFASSVEVQEIQAALGLVDSTVRYAGILSASDILRGGGFTFAAYVDWLDRQGDLYAPLRKEIDRLCVC